MTPAETKSIAAGFYIVKIYNEYSSSSMTIYSPELDDYNNFPQLTNGNYGTEDTSFYYLTLQSSAIIDFTENYSGSIVTIYDTNMSQLYRITGWETKSIAAGSYIVKIYNEYSSSSMTIYSPELDDYNNFPQLTNGNYGTEDTSFYYLTLQSSAIIDFTENYSGSIVTIYDTNMSQLYRITGWETKSIAAGSYIVKIYNEYSSSSMTIYSPELDDYNNFPQLTNGNYGTEDTSFYYLTLQSSAIIDFTENYSGSIITIYDTDMNQLYQVTGWETKNIAAGSYIVKIYNEYSSSSMTIYSSELDDYNNFPQLTNGNYGTEDTSFYYLTLQSSAIIDFTENYSGSIITIYDTDMNQLYQVTGWETKNIAAGSYIVKIYNEYSSSSMTIYSPQLDDYNNFPQLINGNYGTENTSFYYLTLQSPTIIDFTENYSGSIINIYDTDMNQLYRVTNSEARNIAAGSYIVKIYNEYSSDSVTIFGIP